MANKVGGLVSDALKLARPNLQKFWYYARVELTPPSPKDIPEIKNGVVKLARSFKSGAWKELTVKQAFLNMLITTEVVCWFFIGECIGKRHIVGYKLD